MNVANDSLSQVSFHQAIDHQVAEPLVRQLVRSHNGVLALALRRVLALRRGPG